MLRSRLHRFLLASVVVLGVVSFFAGRYIASWRPVQLTEQELKVLPTALKRHEWYSADHNWAADLVSDGNLNHGATFKVWNLEGKHSATAPVPAWGPDMLAPIVALSNGIMAADIYSCGESSCADCALLYSSKSHRKLDLQFRNLEEVEQVKQLQFASDPLHLFVLTTHALYIYNSQTGRFLKKVRVGEGEGQAALTTDGRFYTQFRKFKLSLWDVQHQHLIRRFTQLPGITAKGVEFEDRPFSPDGTIFYYCIHPSSSRLYCFISTLSGRVLWTDDNIPLFLSSRRECFAVKDNIVEVRDTRTGQIIRKLPKIPGESYWLSPDGNTLFSSTGGYNNKKLQVWKQRAR